MNDTPNSWDEKAEKDVLVILFAQAFNSWMKAHDQALREQIATEIERELYRYGDHPLLAETKFGWDSAIRTAARIARGEQA